MKPEQKISSCSEKPKRTGLFSQEKITEKFDPPKLEEGVLDKPTLPDQNNRFTREIMGGTVTFLTTVYILGIQPALMSGEMFGFSTGLNFGALLTTTCLIGAFSTLLMGIWARYPFALAPGMGENFFVVFSLFPVCATALGMKMGDAPVWQLGLGVIFYSGLLFMLLTLFRVRSVLIDIISPSLRLAIGAGIGIFIAYLGFKNAGLIVIENDNLQMGKISSPQVLTFLTGFIVTTVCAARKIPGAIFIGFLIATIVASLTGILKIDSIIGLPNDPRPVLFHVDLKGVWVHIWELWPMLFILTFMNLFDTLGTVLGMGQYGGFMKGNEFPRIDRVFHTDATATMFGALFGHSTITIYMESAAGIESGARTGLASIVTGILFLLALFFTPFLTALGSCLPISAPALVFVGIVMLKCITEIDWKDVTELSPALLIIFGIPFFNSISNGIILGLLVWPILKIATGKYREIKPLFYPLAIALYLYVFFVL